MRWVVYNTATSSIYLYLDGALVTTVASVSSMLAWNNGTFYDRSHSEPIRQFFPRHPRRRARLQRGAHRRASRADLQQPERVAALFAGEKTKMAKMASATKSITSRRSRSAPPPPGLPSARAAAIPAASRPARSIAGDRTTRARTASATPRSTRRRSPVHPHGQPDQLVETDGRLGHKRGGFLRQRPHRHPQRQHDLGHHRQQRRRAKF